MRSWDVDVEGKDMGRSVSKRGYMLSSDFQKTGFHVPKWSVCITRHVYKIEKCRFFATCLCHKGKMIPSFWEVSKNTWVFKWWWLWNTFMSFYDELPGALALIKWGLSLGCGFVSMQGSVDGSCMHVETWEKDNPAENTIDIHGFYFWEICLVLMSSPCRLSFLALVVKRQKHRLLACPPISFSRKCVDYWMLVKGMQKSSKKAPLATIYIRFLFWFSLKDALILQFQSDSLCLLQYPLHKYMLHWRDDCSEWECSYCHRQKCLGWESTERGD